MTEPESEDRSRHFSDGSFFGVDLANECGLHLKFNVVPTGKWVSIECETTIAKRFEGPPGHVHGGITSTLLDEAMGVCCFRNGHTCLSVSMQTFWHEPVPIGETIRIEANIDRVEASRIHAIGRIILPNGKRAVSTSAAYLDRPEVFKKMRDARS